MGSRRCSPTTSSCTATAAARCPRWPARCTAAKRVARTLLAWTRQLGRISGSTIHRVEVNGQPGALLLDAAGGLLAVWALDIADGQIQVVSSIVNPDKLRQVGPLADLDALMKDRDRSSSS